MCDTVVLNPLFTFARARAFEALPELRVALERRLRENYEACSA